MEVFVKNRKGYSYFKESESIKVVGKSNSSAKTRSSKAENCTVKDLQDSILKASHGRLDPSRQRITLNGKALDLGDTEKSLLDLGVTDKSEIVLKDLGPQIGWRTVFYVEYLGPIIIHWIMFFYPQWVFGWISPTFMPSTSLSPLCLDYYRFQMSKGHNMLQTVTFALVMIHFIKRELETAVVHRFSHGTMPLRNIFKNSFHYWLLSGVLIGFAVYMPSAYVSTLPPFVQFLLGGLTSSSKDAMTFRLFAWTILWVFSEVSNLVTHLILRNLRAPGSRERKIPYGYGFSLVSCPNYFYETSAWISVCFMTGNISVWIFTFVSFVQMAIWAKAKHRAYKKTFGEKYPRRRKIMIPFIW